MAKRLTLKFKKQKFQTDAACAVTDAFRGQRNQTMLEFAHDKGHTADGQQEMFDAIGFRNYPLTIPPEQILENIRQIQMEAQLKPSETIDPNDLRLTIEMETGTGKTYTYIKTMLELNKLYGWSKFIVVVPSIAIREGVSRSFEVMSEHFAAAYNKRITSFVYDSKQLTKIDQFATSAGMQVMIINMQAFAARGEDARRIYNSQETFQSRVPIKAIAATNPILIIDEPQSVLGADKKNVTREKLKEFHPLFTLLYSATHRAGDIVNMVYRLDAMDAYNKKFVKKISVKGINQMGTTATNGYLYVESILLSNGNPRVRIGFDKKGKSGVRQVIRTVDDGFDIYQQSGELEEYKNGYRIESIDGFARSIRLLNGTVLYEGDMIGKVNEIYVRRHQIRETILSHIEKERRLFKMGIKCLSLFFIDHVDNYRVYKQGGGTENGKFAEIFEEEYNRIVNSLQLEFADDPEYIEYLRRWKAAEVHDGYFSRDKKDRVVESGRKEGDNEMRGFRLIMQEKEKLLSMEVPVRFIFSHSALKEGWDNPNVFQICTLKDSDNQTKKRQEVGRGMRLCVNSNGERQDEDVLHGRVFEVNELTVIASESYEKFAKELQEEIAEAVGSRPMKVQPILFEGRVVKNASGEQKTLDGDDAQELMFMLRKKDYITKQGQLTQQYYDDKLQRTLDFGEDYNDYRADLEKLLDVVFNPENVNPDNGRKKKEARFDRNKFEQKEFQDLWRKINRRTYYTVDFRTEDLVKHAVTELDSHLRVSKVNIQITRGMLEEIKSKQQLRAGEAMTATGSATYTVEESVDDNVRYDLIGKLVESTGLTRRAIVSILQRISPDTFNMFKTNPEEFIIKAGKIVNQCKAMSVIEHIAYHKLDKTFDAEIFNAAPLEGELGVKALEVHRSLYDLVVVDSDREKKLVKELEVKDEVLVYTKLPRGFYINTPAGHYNPDWAIVFKESADIKHIYFVAETKGYNDAELLDYRKDESMKIECARRHFATIASSTVTYDVVKNYDDLRNIITK